VAVEILPDGVPEGDASRSFTQELVDGLVMSGAQHREMVQRLVAQALVGAMMNLEVLLAATDGASLPRAWRPPIFPPFGLPARRAQICLITTSRPYAALYTSRHSWFPLLDHTSPKPPLRGLGSVR
jgi:hypothetical protein